MAQTLLFDKKQRLLVKESLERAEALTEDYFQVDLGDYDRFPFDVETLANLEGHERTNQALAQICKYEYFGFDWQKKRKNWQFYRICLQDDKILSRVQAESGSLLGPLLLYIVTHELIHVIRFSIEPEKFHLAEGEREVEEKRVHRMTFEILERLRDPKIEILLRHYRPWWEDSESQLTSKGRSLDKKGSNFYFNQMNECWGD